jgi:RNA polymerase sigma factor (sigma-70 family)
MRRDRPDQELLEDTRAGDADAYGEFFARHAEMVRAYLRKRVGSAELAADLVAETFAAALLAVHRGHAEHVPNGAAWLLGIARNKLIDSYRAARVQDAARTELGLPRVAVDDEELERIDHIAGIEQPVGAALEQLSPQEREAIIERIVRERDYSEIASGLGQAETTIRKRVSRGLMRLRQEMGAQPR